jgi:chemotaxis protein MotB
MRKKHPEHVNLERWLVSYADFITLLFAFFVIMYAISQADIAKFKKVSASIKAAFAPGSSAGSIDLEGAAGGGNTANPFDEVQSSGGRLANMPAGKTNTAAESDTQMQEIREQLEEAISLELGVTQLSDKMQMVFDSNGLIVRIAVKDYFEPGEAEVKPDLRPLLDRIGHVIASTHKLIRIEGHTDPSEARR